jgi:hypothetical protein
MSLALQTVPAVLRPILAAQPPQRRVLVVAPHFPPSNAPDGQRARLMIPHLAADGWEADILTVRPEFVEAPLDAELAATLPRELRIHGVLASSPRATRRWRWGSLARRAYAQLKARGDELLAGGRFDLVFFSTCQFGVLMLGPRWLRRHGVPYVLDFHDEWAGDYYRRHPAVRPPGGHFKYRVSHALARWQEGPVVRQAAQIVSVSARYNVNLRARHPQLDPARLHVLPFGGAESDFEVLKRRRFHHNFFTSGVNTNWVYVGRGGPTMEFAARTFFLALQRAAEEQLVPADLCLHFIGTDYATGPRASTTFVPIGRGIAPRIPMREQTERVPHFTALQCLHDADAILVFGADDPGYSASKLAPCLFAGKPVLGIFHEGNHGANLLKETGAGVAVTFSSDDSPQFVAERIHQEWFFPQCFRRSSRLPTAALAACGSAAMTRRLTRIFTAACDATQSSA